MLDRWPQSGLSGLGAEVAGRLCPDEALVAEIRQVLSEAEVLGIRGEGYHKLWARLRFRGIPTSRERVRRLVREHGLQAP